MTPTARPSEAREGEAEALAKEGTEKGRACVVKVGMTGSAVDGLAAWQPHICSNNKRRRLANCFKDAKDPFCIVIVRDIGLAD